MKERILVVDDEPDIVAFIKDSLENEGYEILVANDGKEALNFAGKEVDLILLDIMMPEIDGFSVCDMIRDKVDCPIIFLSAKQSEADKIKGLAVGGDDFIVKPFSIKELKARIEAHLRRQHRMVASDKKKVAFGSLTIDIKGKCVYYKEEKISLTVKEYEIVELLALNLGQVFSKEQIYEKIWGYDADGDLNTVTEHIKRIRTKFLEKNIPVSYINTVWGVGYKWERNV